MEVLKESSNPFDHNLILKLVLEHVGKVSVSDLLTCRMVNHSWNRAAVQVLEQQHDYAVELNYKKLLEFKARLWNTQMSRRQLNSEYKAKLTSLRLSLSIHPFNFSSNLSEVAEAVQLLNSYPHLRLAFLTLFNYSLSSRPLVLFTNHELCNLFKLASNSLTKVATLDDDLGGFGGSPHFEEFGFENYESVEFPRLTTINYGFLCSDVPKNGLTDFTKHMLSIMQRAPKLAKVYLDLYEGNVESTFSAYQNFLAICAAKPNIEELDISDVDAKLVLTPLSDLKFPKMQTFKMRKFSWDFTDEVAQFLEYNCPALRSISMEWFSAMDWMVEDQGFTMKFPFLPNILHFGLYPDYSLRSEYLDVIPKIFAVELAKKFPSLQSMSIDLGVLLMLGAHLKKSGQTFPTPEQYPTFPNITSLEVCINTTDDKYKEEDLTDLLVMASRMYLHTFPALTTLVIKPDKPLLWVSYEALDFLASRSSLQSLEIHNCPSKWINKIPRKVSQSLLELKMLKIFLPRTTTTTGRSHYKEVSRPCPPLVEVVRVLLSFPALEHLQIDKEVAFRTELETTRNLINRFPKPLYN